MACVRVFVSVCPYLIFPQLFFLEFNPPHSSPRLHRYMILPPIYFGIIGKGRKYTLLIDISILLFSFQYGDLWLFDELDFEAEI